MGRTLRRRGRSIYRSHLADVVDLLLWAADPSDFKIAFRAVFPVLSWDHMPTARRLYLLAKDGPGQGAIVEIGSFLGNSTVYLALGSKSAKREPVYAVDPHSEASMTQVPGDPKTSLAFLRNLVRFGVTNQVRYLRATSAEAAASWDVGPVRLLFIDGLHTYDAVMGDYLEWSAHLAKQHVIIFDDYLWPEVQRAVDEIRRRSPPRWSAVRGGQAIFATSRLRLRLAGLP